MFSRDNRDEILQKIGRILQNRGATFTASELTEALELAEEDIRRAGPWPPMFRTIPWTITTTAAYDTGTAKTTLDSKTVTGTGTTWTSAMVGRKFRIDGDWRFYRIATFVSATSITLDENYENDDLDGTSRNYKIYVDEYNLPAELEAVHQIRHQFSNVPMKKKNLKDFFFEVPDASSMGDPEFYDIVDTGVENQPIAAGTLSLSSSSASDGSAFTVLVRGMVSAVKDYEEVTMNGTTAVVTTKSFSRVDQVIKSAAFTGKLTVTADSGNTTIHTIPPEALQVTRRKLWVYPYPENKIRIYVSGWEELPRIIRAKDVPLISSDLYIQAALVYALQMIGEWSKAGAQLQLAQAQMALEIQKYGTSDSDVSFQIIPDTEHYPLGG